VKKKELISGSIINTHGIKYVSDLESIRLGNRLRRFCLFECSCGIIFKSTLNDAYYKRTSCGCKKGSNPKEYKKGDLINGIKFIKSCGTTSHQQRAIFECPICKNEWESLIGNIQAGHTKSCCGVKRGWSKSQWVKLSSTAKLYKVRLYNDVESFIKIGITTKRVTQRFRIEGKQKTNIPYKCEVLKVIEGESGYIFDLENRTKRLFKKYSYKPLISFQGESECYKLK
jgi:hypothetical protein